MRIFVTGATGFIGTAIVEELQSAGHQVIGLARSDQSAAKLQQMGADVHFGSLEDGESLRAAAAMSDGVIHTAFIHDFSQYAANGETDRQAVSALIAGLEGSNKPLVVTSGTTVLNLDRIGTEDMPALATSLSAPRVASEVLAIAAAEKGVRSSVIRLPPSVHDVGDLGFVPALIGIAKAAGVSAYIGDGANQWPSVHRRDAARLFRLACENGVAGARYHGVGEQGVAFKLIADVIGDKLNLPVRSLSQGEAESHFGWIANFVGLHCPASSDITQQALHWSPSDIGLLADLEVGNYFVGA